jgi:hypothetical protein
MNTPSSLRGLSLVMIALLAAGCGAAVSSAPATAESDAGVTADAPPAAPMTWPGCAEVQATCGDEPQRFVRGHAEGLTGLDGARVRFAMRYLREEGNGLNVPHGVVVAGAEVRGGAFEACVCMPRGGNNYPQVAAVVFAPGTTGETSREVVRAMFSQRYATLGDENLSYALTEVASAPVVEAALAGLVDRAHEVRVRGVEAAAATEGRVYAGLVADERPVAAQVVTGGSVEGGGVAFEWIMPGREWPSERVAMVVDRNGNRRCDDGDVGATVRLDGRREVDGVAWVQGDALAGVCAALRMDEGRE